MEIRRGSIVFPPLRGGGPRIAEQTIVFPRTVIRAATGLVGYSFGFGGDDHHVGNVILRADTTVVGSAVTVTITYGLRDWSGTWDDNYEGAFDFAVLADLEDPGAPPRRPDMIVTGLELTQAIQFFRSAQHLDASTAEPDNVVPLIAGKDLGVRAYVDYDASASPSPVGSIRGVLRVTRSAGVVEEVNAVFAIQAKPESEINRAFEMDTLNFLISGDWCVGQMVLECEVFEPSTPDFRSQTFQKTVRFVEVESLRVFCVGVHYTGQGLDLAAPDQADFDWTLSSTERLYPIGEVTITGYTTIDFDRNMKTGDGCGDGFEELLGRLEDLRGGSDDIYLGLIHEDVAEPLEDGTMVGCGDNGVAAAYNGFGPTVAHEIGHLFGRQHAPCDNSFECGEPTDPDSDYPQYNGYDSDSIGEFGFEPGPDNVKPPSVTNDFMGYRFLTWVSPYTYRGLMASFPPVTGMTFAFGRRGDGIPDVNDLWPGTQFPRARRPMLFLRLSIARDHAVTVDPSFVQEGLEGVNRRGRPTAFSVDLCDASGRTLVCRPLVHTCHHCHGGCWPKSFHPILPFPADARMLVVRAGDEIIYQEIIGEPPPVRLSGHVESNGDVTLTWLSDGRNDDVVFQPQRRDEKGVWRGLTPQTKQMSLTIVSRDVPRGPRLTFRVLATRRIATGRAELELEAPVLRKMGQILVKQIGGVVLKARVLDGTGASDSKAEIRWWDDMGREIFRGRTLDLRRFGNRAARLRVSAVRTRDRVPSRLIMVEPDKNRRFNLRQLESDEPAPGPPTPKHRGTPGHTHY